MAPDTWDWGDLEDDEVAPRTATIPLVLNGEVADALDDARTALATAEKGDDSLDGSAVEEAQAEVARLEDLAERSAREFVVRSIGHEAWQTLRDEHPPRPDHQERWNTATFIPAVLLACCDQFTTKAQVADAQKRLPTGQVAKLFAAARVINEGEDRVPTVRGR